jgi:hypothetical protein
MISRSKLVTIGYTAVNAYIGLTLVLYLWEVSRFRCHISDYGFPICFYSLFLVIPIAAIILWVSNRNIRKEHRTSTRVYFGISRLIFVIVWLLSCVPIAFWTMIVQPWPLTLRHGPDTNYSRDGFVRLTGIPPPPSVSGIYFRADEGWLDSGYRLRFNCTDAAVVTQMVERLHLQETNGPILVQKHPSWWADKDNRNGLRTYYREKPHAYYWYLWYDPTSGTVWYEEFSV